MHIKIRTQCCNGFHLGGEKFKTDHLQSFLHYTSLARCKLINVGVLGLFRVQYYDQTNKMVPKMIL